MRIPDILDYFGEAVKPLIERSSVREIGERVLADGRVRRELEEREVLETVASLVEAGIEALPSVSSTRIVIPDTSSCWGDHP